MKDATVFQLAGAAVMLAGVWLFIKDGRTGDNRAKVGPFEFQLSAPSLLFFIVGAAIFCFPFTSWFQGSEVSMATVSAAALAPSSAQQLQPAPSVIASGVPQPHGFEPAVLHIGSVSYCNIPRVKVDRINRRLMTRTDPNYLTQR